MRMYEAMRLGAMLGPQLVGVLVNSAGGFCARGAALLGAGENNLYMFPVETALRCDCPAGCFLAVPLRNLGYTVVHLNNDHRWTREQIADWLEPIEEAFYAEKGTREAPESEYENAVSQA